MTDSVDARPPVAVTLGPLAREPRRGLEVAATLVVRAVQLSDDQSGTRPRDLDRSGRRDLVATARRRELTISGVDSWLAAESLLDPATTDQAVGRLVEAVGLASDLGRLPVSTRLPVEGGEDAIRAVLAVAERLGVPVFDHAVPPRGWEVRRTPGSIEAAQGGSGPGTGPGGLVIPGESEPTEPQSAVGGGTCDGLAVGLDPPAWSVAGLDPLEAAARGVAGLRLADLTPDGMRVPLGHPDGRIDPTTLVAAARTGGFEGLPVIDARRWANPIAGVRVTLQHLA